MRGSHWDWMKSILKNNLPSKRRRECRRQSATLWCRERQRVQDERFARDKERIEDLEKICEKLNRLSIEMGELIKKHDEELNHQSRRLQVIEQKPLRWWEKFAGAVITALGSAVGGGMLVVWVENILQK